MKFIASRWLFPIEWESFVIAVYLLRDTWVLLQKRHMKMIAQIKCIEKLKSSKWFSFWWKKIFWRWNPIANVYIAEMSKLKRKTIRTHENFHVKFYDDLSWKASRSEKQFSKVSSKSVNTKRNNNRERKCAKTANDVSWASAFANLGPRCKSL